MKAMIRAGGRACRKTIAFRPCPAARGMCRRQSVLAFYGPAPTPASRKGPYAMGVGSACALRALEDAGGGTLDGGRASIGRHLAAAFPPYGVSPLRL